MMHLVAVAPIGTPNIVGAFVFAALALFVFSLFVICVYEAIALAMGWAPITAFVRSDLDHHRLVGTVLLVGVGVLVGHFWR